jgi:hypothetical protein
VQTPTGVYEDVDSRQHRRTVSLSPTAALIQAPVAERHDSRSRLLNGSDPMPITEYLDGNRFDPETKRVMGVAFEMTRAALRLADRDDVVEIIARRVIALAKAGERNPDLLCETVLMEFREQRSSPPVTVASSCSPATPSRKRN